MNDGIDGDLADSPFDEGADGMGDVDPGGGPMDRLFDGAAPGPTVGELEADYGISKPWAIFSRGAVRVATGSGIPPIVELVIGGAMGVKRLSEGEDTALPSLGEDRGMDVGQAGDRGDVEHGR